tara:strand:+ start:1681 stop:1854 length:174 start_codon:yes stop_codon:yes gene_type:complete
MNAAMRIYDKMNQQLYRKVGRKYVAETDPYALDGLREGWTDFLIVQNPRNYKLTIEQ